MVQTWPDRDLDNLCKGILNQVGKLHLCPLTHLHYCTLQHASDSCSPIQVRVALAIFHAEADDEVEALFDKKQVQQNTLSPDSCRIA